MVKKDNNELFFVRTFFKKIMDFAVGLLDTPIVHFVDRFLGFAEVQLAAFRMEVLAGDFQEFVLDLKIVSAVDFVCYLENDVWNVLCGVIKIIELII